MDQGVLTGVTRVRAKALCIGQRLELREFERGNFLARSPLILATGTNGAVVLFRYGAAVTFNLDAMEEAAFLANLRPFVKDPFEERESEEVELELAPDGKDGFSRNRIQLTAFTVERLQLVADVLAKSVVLAHLEAGIATHFDRVEPLAVSLQRGGRGGQRGRELLAHIGDVLLVQGKMVGRVEVREKPELIWEAPELEGLYLRLESEYELSERHVALERKLELISRTATTLLELLQNRRSLRVEWYIVILIVVEILMSVAEKIF